MANLNSSPGFSIYNQDGEPVGPEPSATITSASIDSNTPHQVVISPEGIEDWARQVKLDTNIEGTIPDSAVFRPIKDLQSASERFPRWATNQINFRNTASFHKEWRDRLCSALQDGNYQLYDEDDEDDVMPSMFPFIFNACQEHNKARSLNQEEQANKMRLRRAVERLIMFSLDCDGTERLSYRMNKRTRLLATKARRFDVTPPVDGFGLIQIPNFEPCIMSRDFEKAVSAVCIDSKVPSLLLVHLVVSYVSNGSAEDQMKSALVSALHQKKVLGVRDQFAFGIFQFDTGFLRVVAGIWHDDEMKIYQVGTCSFTDPLSVAQFFLIIRGIEDLAKVYESQVVSLGPSLAKAAQEKPPTTEWAQPSGDLNQGPSQGLFGFMTWGTEE